MKRITIFMLCLLLFSMNVLAAEREPVRVAIIDSGVSSIVIDATRIGAGKNYALPDRDTEDTLGHGTAVAGLILKSSPDAELIPLVCCSKTSGGAVVCCDIETTAQMLRDAVDIYSCRVINISAGTTLNSPVLREAIDYVEQQGALVVAAVGNDNMEMPDRVYYPAAYDTVIGVGALRRDGKIASFSQRNNVSLVALGDELEVYRLDGQTLRVSGTSYAAALVSGTVAALLDEYPALSAEQARDILYKSARDLGKPGFDEESGYGVVRMEAALALADNSILPDTKPTMPM